MSKTTDLCSRNRTMTSTTGGSHNTQHRLQQHETLPQHKCCDIIAGYK